MPDKPEGLNHAEGFCLMPYVCANCKTGEWLWNSRDGVTPFMTSCCRPDCDGMMQHVMAGLDIRARIGHRLGNLDFLRRRSLVWHRFFVATFGEEMCTGREPFRPVDGMRVFVDLTMEKACAQVEEMMRDGPEFAEVSVRPYLDDTAPGEYRPQHHAYGAFMEFRNKVAASWCRLEQGGGAPTVETWPIIRLERDDPTG